MPRPWSPPAACDHERSVSSLVSRLSRRHEGRPVARAVRPGDRRRVAGGAPATLGDFERVGFRVARGLPVQPPSPVAASPPPPPPPFPSPRQSSRRSCRCAAVAPSPAPPPVAPFGSEGTFASLPPRSTRSARAPPPPTADGTAAGGGAGAGAGAPPRRFWAARLRQPSRPPLPRPPPRAGDGSERRSTNSPSRAVGDTRVTAA